MKSQPSPHHAYHFELNIVADREQRKQIQAILRAYNEQVCSIRGPEAQSLNIYVTDEQRQLIGGMIAATYWGWLVIDILALVEAVRGQGLGKELMARTEAEARRRGCTRSQTTTYAHQALGFYQRLGYRVVGQMEDYPEGYTYYWLQKDL